MKFTFLLLTVAMLHASANVNGQVKVTVRSNQVEIARVLASIEKQSDYRFLYNNALKSLHQKIDIDVHDLGIDEVLGKVFANTDLTYKMLENNLIVVMAATSAPQDIQVTGKITGDNGEPLSGVSVALMGTSRGTATDNNGNFTITAPQDGTLLVSYIGYQSQEVKIGNRPVIDVQLHTSTKQLDQVVVVGYGVQKKIDVTGSVGHVKGEELVKQPVLTATQAIQGKLAGVQVISSGQPGSLPQVIIRGTGSILAGASPLYVVDGIWTDDITNINTADITSVDVLKDASACSIYGVRGANGVILITTRQGSGKMKVNYTANVGVQQAAYVVPMADAKQYQNYVQAILGLPFPATPYNTDWYKQALRNAFYNNHTLSVAGSSQQDKYALSVGYETNQGIIILNDYSRYTVRFNNEFTPTSFLKLGTTMSYAYQTEQNVPGGTITEDAYRASPMVPAILNGKYGNTSQYQNVGNPLVDALNTNDQSHNNRLQGNVYVEIKPVSSLSLRSTFNDEANFYDDRQYIYQRPNDTTFFTTNGGSQGPNHSTLTAYNGRYYHWVWSNTVNFTKEFGKHRLNVLAGTEAQEYYNSAIMGSRFNVSTAPSEWYIQNGDQANQFNGSSVNKYRTNSYLGRLFYSYDDRFLITANFRADGSSVFAAANRWGYFPGISAGWVMTRENFMENQHIFQYLKLKGSWGELGNSNIPPDASQLTILGNVPYFFNSGNSGGGSTTGAIVPQIKDLNIKWEVTKESDLGFEYAVLKGKLTGEVDVYDKKVTNALIYVQVPGTFGSQANPLSTIAAGDVLTNAAEVDNKGLEFSARWSDKINDKLSYFVGGNVSFNRNRVLNLNGGLPFYDGNINGYFVTETKPGYPIGAFFMRKVIGVFQDQNQIDNYKDKNGNVLQPGAEPGDFIYQYKANGTLDTAFVGSYQPKAYVGLQAGVNYGDFDLSVDVYANFGNQVYNGKAQARVVYTDNIERSMATSFWQPGAHSNTQPRANGGNMPASTYFLSSGTFVRINNATLGYTLPARILSGQKVISSLRIFLNAQNAFTWKKYSGFSSELPGYAGVNLYTGQTPQPTTNAGIEYNTYPTTRTFAVGLNVGL